MVYKANMYNVILCKILIMQVLNRNAILTEMNPIIERRKKKNMLMRITHLGSDEIP